VAVLLCCCASCSDLHRSPETDIAIVSYLVRDSIIPFNPPEM